MVPARPLYVLHRTSGIDRKPEMAWRGGTGYTAPHKIAGSGPGAAQGSAEAVAAAVPGWGVLTQAVSYVVKARQRRDR